MVLGQSSLLGPSGAPDAKAVSYLSHEVRSRSYLIIPTDLERSDPGISLTDRFANVRLLEPAGGEIAAVPFRIADIASTVALVANCCSGVQYMRGNIVDT